MNDNAMVFVDGENLRARYEAMVEDGEWRPQSSVTHIPGKFVWSPHATDQLGAEILRVTYYTTVVSDYNGIRELEREIVKRHWSQDPFGGSARRGTAGSLTPRVFKKASKSQKTASVDINITIDVLRHCFQKDLGVVYIISGDGDYIPLIQEAMRTGTRVVVGALSSGLNEDMKIVPDRFIPLDLSFFLDR